MEHLEYAVNTLTWSVAWFAVGYMIEAWRRSDDHT